MSDKYSNITLTPKEIVSAYVDGYKNLSARGIEEHGLSYFCVDVDDISDKLFRQIITSYAFLMGKTND